MNQPIENPLLDNTSLHMEFEILRKQLEAEAIKCGLTNPYVVAISQQLDKVHNMLLIK